MVPPMPASAATESSRVWRGRAANMQNTMITTAMISMAARSGPEIAYAAIAHTSENTACDTASWSGASPMRLLTRIRR